MTTNTTREQYLKELGSKNSIIISALYLALEKHTNQERKSGEPYIEHCIAVYKILKSWGVTNNDLLTAAILHDVVEDSDIKIEEINTKFGPHVASLVESVTQLKIAKTDNQDFQTLQKIIVQSFVDPMVSILKLADRCHNLSTLQYMPSEKRVKKAKESLEVYAKLAESLGLWVIKTTIEDLSFQYLYFDKYSKVKLAVDSDPRLVKEEIVKVTNVIKSALKKPRIQCKLEVKKGGYFHVYQKLEHYSMEGVFSNENYHKLNDVISYRVIVKTKEDCYRALYAIHRYFGNRVDYSRFDEFMNSNKRVNGYEALQTTVDTDHGSVEIAIVTEDMENFNNWGYLSILKKKVNTHNYNLKLVFTPSYDLIFLPENARAIDFAYAVNVKLGDSAVNVTVNGEPRGLDYKVTNTDLINVITGTRTVQEDMRLSDISLPMTKNYLQKKIVNSERIESIILGKNILENYLAPRGILDLSDINQGKYTIAYTLGCSSVDDIYYKIAKGYLGIERLDSLLNENNITKGKLGWTTVQVTGKDQPGLLKLIAGYIAQYGGNIIRINFHKEASDTLFNLRIVAENVSFSDMKKLKDILQHKGSFKELKVV